MIYFIIGTKAQFIKMAPVIRAADMSACRYRIILTGQHKDTIGDLATNFGVRKADSILYEGPDVTSVSQMLVWSIKLIWKTITNRREIFSDREPKSIVLIHGDTFSTLIGALMGKMAGLKVGHVESGLRSFNFFHPFPEELTRLAVFRLSDVYFCPGDWALNNLRGLKGCKVNTYRNTLYDSLQYALGSDLAVNIDFPAKPFGVVSLHRFENICSRKRLLRVVEIIERIARDHFLLFIMHKPTERKLVKYGLYDRLNRLVNVELRGRYDYISFVKILKRAKFVVSDGGSNQEECFYLGKPVLLLRRATERNEGINLNCCLSGYDDTRINSFMATYETMSAGSALEVGCETSPSEIVADFCLNFSEVECR